MKIFSLLILCSLTLTKIIKQVYVISQHCESTPLDDSFFIPKFPVHDWRNIPQISVGFGEITPRGQHQCFSLGKKIHSRYIENTSPQKIDKMFKKYSNFDHYFQADKDSKSIQSLVSITNALFPRGENGTAPTYDNGKFSLPRGSSVVPIVTKDSNDDIELRSLDLCDYVPSRLLPDHFKSPEWLKMEKDFEKDKLAIFKECGFSNNEIRHIKLYDILRYYELVLLLKKNNLHSMSDENLEKMEKIVNGIVSSVFNRQLISNYGGNVISSIVKLMNNFVSHGKNVNTPKYYHYVVNRNNMLGILTALKLLNDYKDLREFPHNGFTLVFEVFYEEKKKEFFIDVVILKLVHGEFEEYILKSLGPVQSDVGCGERCSVGEFALLAQDAIPVNYCEICQSTALSENCIHQQISGKKLDYLLLWVLIFIVFVILLLIIAVYPVVLTCRYAVVKKKKKKEYNYMPGKYL